MNVAKLIEQLKNAAVFAYHATVETRAVQAKGEKANIDALADKLAKKLGGPGKK